jgi:hypothetical protein
MPVACCGKAATLMTPLQTEEKEYFCPRHAKTQSTYVLPTAEIAATTIKKYKVDGLREFGLKHRVFKEDEVVGFTKPQLLERVLSFFESRRLILIPKPKVKNANQTDLVQIGKSIKRAFSEIVHIPLVTHVLIENQISTVASRMKTIQGMVAQYFIMVLDNPQIEFISSSNKLKHFVSTQILPESSSLENTFTPISMEGQVEDSDEDELIEVVVDQSEKGEGTVFNKAVYKKHKSDAVKYCLEILEKHQFNEWSSKMVTHKKQDDLADCFLQGYWYFSIKCQQCVL